jgi:hypothetical protein
VNGLVVAIGERDLVNVGVIVKVRETVFDLVNG